MESTIVRLMQTTKFLAGRKSKECKRKVLEFTKGRIPPGDSDDWHDTALKIPALPPSKLLNCNNIQIQYTIEVSQNLKICIHKSNMLWQFRVDPGGMSFDLCLQLPIVIGTIPLRSTFNNFQSSPAASNTPSAPPFSAKPGPPRAISVYTELPPPTYEEAIGDDLTSLKNEEENEFVNGNWDFRPQYPSYG